MAKAPAPGSRSVLRDAAPAPLTAAAMRRLDLNALELGVPLGRLVQNAGRALARHVASLRPASVLVLAGKGHNGADGIVAASLLAKAGIPTTVLSSVPASALPQVVAGHVGALSGTFFTWPERPRSLQADVVIDALLGTGSHGPPRPPTDALLAILARQRKAGARIVACDIPSAFGTPAAVPPHSTVTFHAAKPGMTRANSGEVVVAPVGIPAAAANRIGLGDLEAGYRIPRADSHKGDNGRILAVAGSIPYTGAPYYLGQGAYRSGADLVHAVVPDEAAPAVRSYGPHLIVHPTRKGSHLAHPAVALDLLDRVDTLAIGPGLGTHRSTRDAAARLIDAAGERGKSIVVDADALDALTPDLLQSHGARMVLTPHAKEFLDLSGQAATPRNVKEYARRHGVTVLRKSHQSIVTDGQRLLTSHRGHPTLTVGGTGDVLAGCVAALLAKGAPPFEAAAAATYMLGCAGELAAATWGYGATATEVADALPAVLQRLSW